jgi:2-keto-4-pentenoate hydratase
MSLSKQLADAWSNKTTLQAAHDAPADAGAAYRVQDEIIALRGGNIGGWKVGAKSADGPVQGAPLPADFCVASGARLPRAAFQPLGLELEVAFRFGRTFAPQRTAYTESEVLESISSMLATIEVVASRFARWPEIDKLSQLADLQNHGALVAGEAVPFKRDWPFESPQLGLTFNGASIWKDERGVNPAGDPRRLLTWLVNHCAVNRGIAITPETVITAGSYTGMHFVQEPGVVRGEFAGLPPVEFELV